MTPKMGLRPQAFLQYTIIVYKCIVNSQQDGYGWGMVCGSRLSVLSSRQLIFYTTSAGFVNIVLLSHIVVVFPLYILFLLSIDQGVILDRSVYSDCVFAKVCTNEGFISSEGKPKL